ncbi:hypothetical protein D3C81_2306030 [compost metagenome]
MSGLTFVVGAFSEMMVSVLSSLELYREFSFIEFVEFNYIVSVGIFFHFDFLLSWFH